MTEPIRLLVGFLAFLMLVVLGCGGGSSGGTSGGPSSPPATGSASAFNQARGFNGTVRSIVPIGDGSRDVWVAGDFTVYQNTASNRIIRLHADGTIAQAFANGFNERVEVVVPATDGSGDVYVLGPFTQYNGQAVPFVIRLNRDGSRDAAFVVASFDSRPVAMAPAQDGSGDLYVAGAFTNYGGVLVNHLARLNSDGTLDRAFTTGSGFSGFFESGLRGPRVIATENGAGRIYAAGPFAAYNGVPAGGFVRILPDGRLDPTFMTGTGVNASPQIGVQVIRPADDGTRDVYLGGQIASYNDKAVNFIVKIHENGTLDETFLPPPILAFAIAPAGPGSSDVYVSGFSFNPGGGEGRNRLVRLRGERDVLVPRAVVLK